MGHLRGRCGPEGEQVRWQSHTAHKSTGHMRSCRDFNIREQKTTRKTSREKAGWTVLGFSLQATELPLPLPLVPWVGSLQLGTSPALQPRKLGGKPPHPYSAPLHQNPVLLPSSPASSWFLGPLKSEGQRASVAHEQPFSEVRILLPGAQLARKLPGGVG